VSTTKNKRRIMIIDDDEYVMNLFTKMIEESGYDTSGFTIPIVAIDYMNIHHDKFGLIVFLIYFTTMSKS
jgi:FixJ family two-component response regulator